MKFGRPKCCTGRRNTAKRAEGQLQVALGASSSICQADCVQAFLERCAKEEPRRLEGVRVALEAALKRLIGRDAAALMVPEGDSWSWGVDLPAAGYLLQVLPAAAAAAAAAAAPTSLLKLCTVVTVGPELRNNSS